ncbi:hypothetical protein [Motiliproteus sp. MSK22-1]|uniref:hypothetical protein n=1 Tax=Motiliproteus sp. MSK22-1 TaxID=1897630 RepID=UPI0011811D55|nr:hypothetical protein [Motiliproteus sp. MSK22-1]
MFEKETPIIPRRLDVHRALGTVCELDGFLNAIRCIIDCPRRLFSATLIEKETTLEAIILEDIDYIDKNGNLLERSVVAYKPAYELFVNLIYNRISESKTSATDNLDWNLIEYYGLLSTADIEDGPWNRFISQEHSILRFINADNCECLMFYVEFSDFVVATQLGVQWNELQSKT